MKIAHRSRVACDLGCLVQAVARTLATVADHASWIRSGLRRWSLALKIKVDHGVGHGQAAPQAASLPTIECRLGRQRDLELARPRAVTVFARCCLCSVLSMLGAVVGRDDRTETSAFGVGRRESHDSSRFYARFTPPLLSDDDEVNRPDELLAELGSGRLFHGQSQAMTALPDNSVALVVTSPPYFVGKEYELAVADDDEGRIPATYLEFLTMLRDVFRECRRVLEPGGRIAVNVANLGRKPYRSLSADVTSILQDDLGLLLRGEIIWEKAGASSSSCAWGSFAKPSNPVLRDVTERVIVASKGSFSRAKPPAVRRRQGLPHEATLTNDEFVETTRDVWRIDAESATKVGHPAPFPVELPRRLIDLHTYVGDIVVDPFAGAGTTLVAAARTGRIGVGYDIDPAYLELAQRRLDAELQRRDRLDAVAVDAEPGLVGDLVHDERQEHFQARALDEARRVQDIAQRCLEEAGFEVSGVKPKHPSRVLTFDFAVTNRARTHTWWVEVAGAFTTSRPGLQRIDAVWKVLGRLHVAAAQPLGRADDDGDPQPTGVLVLTPGLPKAGSPADKALRAAGPGAFFDAIELYDPVGLARLGHYATGEVSGPLPGFWP